MSAMRERSFDFLGSTGFTRIAYTEWGDIAKPTVVCLHGLTRNGRDFDFLASALAGDYRVICPDMPGRGKSAWLNDSSTYVNATYLHAVAALIARLDVEKLDLVGASMGGLLGMMLASQRGSPVRRLVINDVGPVIAPEGLARVATYVGRDTVFTSVAAIEAEMRQTFVAWGSLSDAAWSHLAKHCARRRPDGSYGFAYDPKIAEPFRAGALAAVDLWSNYDAIRCPTLLIRGAISDILRPDDAAAMTQRGPRARLVELPGVGHAPTFTRDVEIAAVRDFLG